MALPGVKLAESRGSGLGSAAGAWLCGPGVLGVDPTRATVAMAPAATAAAPPMVADGQCAFSHLKDVQRNSFVWYEIH